MEPWLAGGLASAAVVGAAVGVVALAWRDRRLPGAKMALADLDRLAVVGERDRRGVAFAALATHAWAWDCGRLSRFFAAQAARFCPVDPEAFLGCADGAQLWNHLQRAAFRVGPGGNIEDGGDLAGHACFSMVVAMNNGFHQEAILWSRAAYVHDRRRADLETGPTARHLRFNRDFRAVRAKVLHPTGSRLLAE